MRFDPVEFTGLDQGRDDGPVLCACIMSCEERVFTVQSDGAYGALHRVVVEFDAAIVEEQAQAVPVFGDIFQGFSGRRFGRDAGAALGEPNTEGFDNGF